MLFYSTVTIRPLTGGTDMLSQCGIDQWHQRTAGMLSQLLPHEGPASTMLWTLSSVGGSSAFSSLHDQDDHLLHMNTPRTTTQTSIESRNHRESVRLRLALEPRGCNLSLSCSWPAIAAIAVYFTSPAATNPRGCGWILDATERHGRW
jgi:hypothetical protein